MTQGKSEEGRLGLGLGFAYGYVKVRDKSLVNELEKALVLS